MYKKTILNNGLRIITVPDKKAKTATVLILVGAGSKYENKDNNGVSHFLEHMFFKGTQKRPSTLEIAETLDRIGGAYNAFTSKEITGYWAKVSSEHMDLALDWVSDIFLNSKLKDIGKEKQVIIEELNMYLDTPMAYIGDLWEELLYGNQPAGWKPIGTKENILKFQRNDFTKYMKDHYSSKNTIVCIAGNFNEKQTIQNIKAHFKSINTKNTKQKNKVLEKQSTPKVLHLKKDTDQSHICLGVRGYDIFHKDRYAQVLISIILGANMSSRLFIKLRQKHGLAYYIRTSSEHYTDTGYLVTQAGTAHKDMNKAIDLILKEYKNLDISNTELKKAKDYLKGSTVLSLESSDAEASFYAAQELLTNNILTIKQKFGMIDKVTIKDIKRVSKDLFQDHNLNLAIIGPKKNIWKTKHLL